MRARTTDAQGSLFHRNPKLLGLGRQFGQTIFGAFGVFSANLLAPILVLSPLSMFSIIPLLFLQKTKPLYPNPKYLLGLGFEFGPQRIRYLAIVCP